MKRAKKMLFWIVAALLAAFVVFALVVRFAPDDPRAWHVDPKGVAERGAQNDFIVNPSGNEADIASPVYDMSPAALAEAFRAVAMGSSRVSLLAESGDYSTYIQRTALMAYPDYISVRAEAVDGGAALYVYSRSRYGLRDFDVNKKRILSWLKKL